MKELVTVGILGAMFVIVGAALGGPVDMRNFSATAARAAEDAAKADPLYVPDETYIADLEAANNLAQLKAILLRKARSDKMRKDKASAESAKVKEGKAK